jgi:hypothetical protein
MLDFLQFLGVPMSFPVIRPPELPLAGGLFLEGGFRLITHCQSFDDCQARHGRLQSYLAHVLERARADHEAFLRGLSDGTALLQMSDHLLDRQGMRAVSRDHVQEIIECGTVLEWFRQHDASGWLLAQFRMLLGGMAGKEERPLHVAVLYGPQPRPAEEEEEKQQEDETPTLIGQPWVWRVETVYDPRTRQFQWSRNFSERVCFCASRKVQ